MYATSCYGEQQGYYAPAPAASQVLPMPSQAPAFSGQMSPMPGHVMAAQPAMVGTVPGQNMMLTVPGQMATMHPHRPVSLYPVAHYPQGPTVLHQKAPLGSYPQSVCLK